MKKLWIAALAAAFSMSALVAPVNAQDKMTSKKAPVTKKGPVKSKKAYACPKCHMTFTAAEAKKDKYMCPMDHKKMVKIASGKMTPKKPTPKKPTK